MHALRKEWTRDLVYQLSRKSVDTVLARGEHCCCRVHQQSNIRSSTVADMTQAK
jgi:hypothetical protein